ncbi:MAG: hypothetical protein RMH74_04580 [Candidatus Caldarchaeum sp.]|nr:hypothetical protein [Candidatus Caldarchaeum sp.]
MKEKARMSRRKFLAVSSGVAAGSAAAAAVVGGLAGYFAGFLRFRHPQLEPLQPQAQQ